MPAQADSDATRASLLSRARQRDSAAWHELLDLYGPLVAHWCYRCGLDSHAAADCVQDTFGAVLKSLQSFQPRRESGAFRGWLWSITSNKIKDHQRRERRQAEAAGGSTALGLLEQFPDHDVSIDEEPTDREQLSQVLLRALDQVRAEFETRTWDMFRRVVIDRIATAVVADEFAVTHAAVRQARSRILRRLRQQLGDIEY